MTANNSQRQRSKKPPEIKNYLRIKLRLSWLINGNLSKKKKKTYLLTIKYILTCIYVCHRIKMYSLQFNFELLRHESTTLLQPHGIVKQESYRILSKLPKTQWTFKTTG